MFRKIRWFSLAIGLLAVLAAPTSLCAQAGTGSISGNVSDHHGAPLGGAKVTLVSEDTKVSTGASTDGTGHYRFEGLKPGYYDLTDADMDTVTVAAGPRLHFRLGKQAWIRPGISFVRGLDARGVVPESARTRNGRFPSTGHLRFCRFWRFWPERSAAMEHGNR